MPPCAGSLPAGARGASAAGSPACDDARMDEVVTGIVHWSSIHPNTGVPAHSHFLMAHAHAARPDGPEGGHGLVRPARRARAHPAHQPPSPARVGAFADAYECSDPLPSPTACTSSPAGRTVEPFEPGDEPAPGVRVCEVGAITPEEVALHVADRARARCSSPTACGACDDGALGFFPDHLLGDDPEAVKAGLRAAYRRLLRRAGVRRAAVRARRPDALGRPAPRSPPFAAGLSAARRRGSGDRLDRPAGR